MELKFIEEIKVTQIKNDDKTRKNNYEHSLQGSDKMRESLTGKINIALSVNLLQTASGMGLWVSGIGMWINHSWECIVG